MGQVGASGVTFIALRSIRVTPREEQSTQKLGLDFKWVSDPDINYAVLGTFYIVMNNCETIKNEISFFESFSTFLDHLLFLCYITYS